MSQACFSVFLFILPVDSFRLSRAASVAILPSALLVERFSLGAWWVLARPRRASLCGYCAVVRTPLQSPTTDAVVPPTFWPPQQPLVSWHFSLRARQGAVPIAADHYLPQRVPGCSAPPAPASSANKDLLLY